MKDSDEMPSQQLHSTIGLAAAVLLWSHFQQCWEKGKSLSKVPLEEGMLQRVLKVKHSKSSLLAVQSCLMTTFTY